MKKKRYTIKSAAKRGTLEDRFDAGESVLKDFDVRKAQVMDAIQRVNIDFPSWAVQELDQEAKRRNISRQALVKTWIIEHLDSLRVRRP